MNPLTELYKFLMTSPYVSKGTLVILCLAGIWLSWRLIKLMAAETVASVKTEYKKRTAQLDVLCALAPEIKKDVTIGVTNHLDHMEKDTCEIKLSNIAASQTLIRMETKADERHGEMIRVLSDIRDEFRSKPQRLSRAVHTSRSRSAARKKR